MLYALIVVAVLAVGASVMYLQVRSSGAEFRRQAEGRETALETERDSLTEANAQLDRDLTTAKTENVELRKQANISAAEVRRLGGELDKAGAIAAEQTDRIEGQIQTIEGQVGRIATLESERSGWEARVEAAETAAAAIAARDTGVVIGDIGDVGGAQPETLWSLEITRSERTWRTSVAPNPTTDPDPFESTDDPVRLAVEIEAGALRENVGAFITIDWQAKPITEPGRAHLVVRVAQELLEAAARSPEPSRLVATGDEEITLALESVGDSEEVINIIPPRITSDLVEAREETATSLKIKTEAKAEVVTD